ncbi:hypothetical protein [Zhihengliuella salsuginis]|uniref:Uncharacterized protein n=1 Tax=Zhihengliuella salsuginis TaxID=578222 RepID=A0ABQ3GJZ7_9MICC|nr:hypothetical protein [Zhihengliuella salsuginis]GHD11681.1 hypothetical protein GCM10008096_26340 [Zhihengliuella salsuginis]
MGRQASQGSRTDADGVVPGARHARQEGRFAIRTGYPDPFLPPFDAAPLLGTTRHSAGPAEPHEDTGFIKLISQAPTADKIARKRLVARAILIIAVAAVPLVALGLYLS